MPFVLPFFYLLGQRVALFEPYVLSGRGISFYPFSTFPFRRSSVDAPLQVADDGSIQHLTIDLGGRNVAVSQQLLHRRDVGSLIY